MAEPDFSIGIEEEYLLVHADTMELAEGPPALVEDCFADLGDQVSPEFLRCQIEVGTKVCNTVEEARADLQRLRAGVSARAAEYGLIPIAASCHPFAKWDQQHHTDKDRYNQLHKDLAGVASRMLISGMHVHVGLPRDEMRIDLCNQFSYFLPHLLALSASSPYWQGKDTGLASYRLTVFDNLPRTGLPPNFASWAEYRRSVDVLIDLGVIEDTTKVWWDLRPSARFPTLESRICDVLPRLDHTLAVAALTQATMRMLWRLSRANQRWRVYDNFLVGENRWRAQRYGIEQGLIDFGRQEVVPMPELVAEWLDLVAEDLDALQSTAAAEMAQDIVAGGTSSQRQRDAYSTARASGADHDTAMRAVVRHLVEEFHADL